MVKIVTDEKQIQTLHKAFHQQLSNFLTEKISCTVGFPSGSFQDIVKYSSELNIWVSKRIEAGKFWNGFGIGEPLKGRNNSLKGEINFPFELNRRISGVFAIEEDGNVLVLHRGKIGGGKVGVGKNLFLDNFRGDFVQALEEEIEERFCLVGELNSQHFSRQVADFINEIDRIKVFGATQAYKAFEELNNFNFLDEHSGKSEIEKNGTCIIDRTHGIVVNTLAKELERRKYKIGNDKNRDLFIHKNNQINKLFEVKTSCATQHLYAAVGQLIIYSIPIKNEVDLFIVLPDKLKNVVAERLYQLGISPLYYKWNKDLPIFLNLNEILI